MYLRSLYPELLVCTLIKCPLETSLFQIEPASSQSGETSVIESDSKLGVFDNPSFSYLTNQAFKNKTQLRKNVVILVGTYREIYL